MGRARLVLRLAVRNLRRRPVEAALLWLAIVAATTTFTLGLSLHGVTDGRIANQTRRVGSLKAVGGTPGLVALVLLAEYTILALLAAVTGLGVGRLAAPLLVDPGAGLLGSAGTPSLPASPWSSRWRSGSRRPPAACPRYGRPPPAPSGPWPTGPANPGARPG